MIHLFLLCCFALIPGCIHKKNAKVSKKEVLQETHKRYQLYNAISTKQYNESAWSSDDASWTQQEAVRYALSHNPTIHAALEEVGIAASDLKQAGFYSNPEISAIFKLPKSGARTNIDVQLSYTISDLWQVPLRESIAQDDLEIQSLNVLNTMVNFIADVKKAYVRTIYQRKLLANACAMQQLLNKVKKRVVLRYQNGYGNKLDIAYACLKYQLSLIDQIEQETTFNNACTDFQALLNLPLDRSVQPKENKLLYIPKKLDPQRLFSIALKSRPEITISQMKIEKAKHTISYEKSKIIGPIKFGINAERELERNRAGIGPAFNISLPLFDRNEGNIDRAEFEKSQAEKILHQQIISIQQEVQKLCTQLNGYSKQLSVYQHQSIPCLKKAAQFAEKQFNIMQMNLLEWYHTLHKLFTIKKEKITLQLKQAEHYIELEKTISVNLADHH